MRFINSKGNFIAIVILVFTSSQAVCGKIDKSFKVIFWGLELGYFNITGKITDFHYDVSINASTRGIINLVSETRIRSGSMGTVSGNRKFKPIQSITKWNRRRELRESILKYHNGEVILFEASPELRRDYHIHEPIGIRNSLDPVSAALWFLDDRKERDLCEGTLSIFDGFRLSELVFTRKTVTEKGIKCVGDIRRLSGFKELKQEMQPIDFIQHFHRESSNSFVLKRFEMNTVFGRLAFEYLS